MESVEVELQVKDHVATVISTLNYQNKEDKPVEAVFVFPLPGDAAVCHFSAGIGETHIVAELKGKQQACEEYDDALSSGQQAFLLEESEETPDHFSLSVGNLLPGQSVFIRLEYVTILTVEADNGLRFCLPTVLNPRYQPQASEVPYSLSFSARVSSPRPVSKVESSCSLEPLQFLNSDHTEAAVKLAAGHKFDRDVELLIYYKDAHQPSAVVEAGQDSAEPGTLMGDPVVMLSLYPEFPESLMSPLATCGEFVFLLDRSGSMGCPASFSYGCETLISRAKDTLLLLLKSLPTGSYFNIYGFGSRFSQIFPNSVEYSEETMEEALKKVEGMQSDLGGTDILQPLKYIYSQPFISNLPRQSLKSALEPVVKDISVVWDLPKGVSATVLSPPITTIVRGQRSTIYAQLSGKILSSQTDCSVTLNYTLGNRPFRNQLQFHLNPSKETGLTVHRLAARSLICSLIRSLEVKKRVNRGKSDEDVKKKVVELSVQSGVSSGHTAFIAVNKDSGDAVQGPLMHGEIPRLGRHIASYGRVLVCHYPQLRCCTRPPVQDDFGVTRRRSVCSAPLYSSARTCSPALTFLEASEREPPRRDPLLQLQKASGCWLLDEGLPSVLGKTSEEVEKSKPAEVSSEVWATILALTWLHGFKMDAKDEWELLAVKAASWVQAQNAPCLKECVDAANALLGCRVQKEALGL
ncbi:von Willebrand factor A domain-containing protein 5A-like [Oryzias melastigma]|uniref:von Willebrand factor A domain-containing protein 5A-like n=1 Tax=Oryzias melastigma TaxID=30732 RepID=UPI00168D2F63|nr:von Willebrand factor A domain-containing protein 5A-like [Oryzias melastigma]